MRIALVAPPWFSVSPKGYGGVEWVVSHLADGLTARGHDVTLFAAGGSGTAARLVETFPEPPSLLIGDSIVEAAHLLDAYARWDQFDIIHDHTMLGLLAGATVPVPVVHTLHGPVLDRYHPFYERVSRNVHLVCISDHQRSTLPPGIPATVIHNGVCLEDFPFGERPRDYLLFVGRMSPTKGVLEAIQIAKACGRKLMVIAKVNERPEHEYFNGPVAAALREIDATVILEAPHEVKRAAYRDAYATLFPITWPEPFGLVMAESMAAGTPVIAFRNGSVPEVIVDGVTGFICDSVEQAAACVNGVATIDRRACREHVQRFFSREQNVERHEALYRDIVGGLAPSERDVTVVAGGGQAA